MSSVLFQLLAQRQVAYMTTALSPPYNVDVTFSFSFSLESNSACTPSDVQMASLLEQALN
jgi:hypothetical protein